MDRALESHQLQIPFTTFHGLKTAIIASWPVLQQIDINDLVPLPYKPEHIKVICKDSKGSKSMYNIFISNLYQKPKSEEKWKTEFHLDDDFSWKAINKRCFGCTNDTQLLWFHYRVLHRILGTNDYLFKCNIKNSPVCNLCRTETELQGTYSLNVEQHKKYGPKLKLGLETPLALIILSLPKTLYLVAKTKY